jgi:hypothetical protein
MDIIKIDNETVNLTDKVRVTLLRRWREEINMGGWDREWYLSPMGMNGFLVLIEVDGDDHEYYFEFVAFTREDDGEDGFVHLSGFNCVSDNYPDFDGINGEFDIYEKLNEFLCENIVQ